MITQQAPAGAKEIFTTNYHNSIAPPGLVVRTTKPTAHAVGYDLSRLRRCKWRANLFMSEEIFDVVNEHDEVVGKNTRREVHRLGLLHRAVHVLVFKADGEVFLQQRSMKKDRHPGVWDSSASGHVDSGEDYDTTAVREVWEEIGLDLRTQAATGASPPRRLFKINPCPETDAEFVWVYRCESEGPFQLNAEEIMHGGWFAPEAVTRWIRERPEEFAPAFAFIWSKLA